MDINSFLAQGGQNHITSAYNDSLRVFARVNLGKRAVVCYLNEIPFYDSLYDWDYQGWWFCEGISSKSFKAFQSYAILFP